jgi:hypothetical protein
VPPNPWADTVNLFAVGIVCADVRGCGAHNGSSGGGGGTSEEIADIDSRLNALQNFLRQAKDNTH